MKPDQEVRRLAVKTSRQRPFREHHAGHAICGNYFVYDASLIEKGHVYRWKTHENRFPPSVAGTIAAWIYRIGRGEEAETVTDQYPVVLFHLTVRATGNDFK